VRKGRTDELAHVALVQRARARGEPILQVLAETSYAAFSGKDAITVRLVVRRRVRPTPGSQLALFTTWDYHAFVTNRPGEVLEIDADHRRHAVVEQRIAELKSAGLAHLPSGNFMANAAWLALTVMAHNRAGPWVAWPARTSNAPPLPPCNDGSAPFRDGWRPADDNAICGYQPADRRVTHAWGSGTTAHPDPNITTDRQQGQAVDPG